jgi:hypothetical protein
MTKILWFILTIIIFGSCTDTRTIDLKAENFAKLECRAIKLRERRFELASEMHRLQEDSLEYLASGDSLLQIINDVKNQSVLLADSIRQELDYLWATTLNSKEKRMLFHEKVKYYNTKNNCIADK